MTSLASQLSALRTSTAQQLTVEKKHVSLLFDRQEAGTLDREAAFKIGCTGLEHLKKLDNVFKKRSEFFDVSALNVQRTMMTKDENERLNKLLTQYIVQLSPYAQHFACHQVLEWLIYKYQIHAYNAETLVVAFMPFHETNFYGRLLSVLEFNFESSADFSFLAGYAKKALPVPFSKLVANALVGSHALMSIIASYINSGIESVGAEFMEVKLPVVFTLFAKILVLSLEDGSKVNDSVVSKVIPLVATAIKSDVASYRNAAFMAICQLVVTVKLSPSVVSALVKVLILKMDDSVSSALTVLLIICQNQAVSELPKKATVKLLKRSRDNGFWAALKTLATTTIASPLLVILWDLLFVLRSSEDFDENEIGYFIARASDVDCLKSADAETFFEKLMENEATEEKANSKSLRRHVKALSLRFSDEWMNVYREWSSRNKQVVDAFVTNFNLEDTIVESEAPKRRRSLSTSENVEKPRKEKSTPISAESKAKAMSENSEFAKRPVFSGDPIDKCLSWLKAKDGAKVQWALDEISMRKMYLSSKRLEDVENFLIAIVRSVQQQDGLVQPAEARTLFAQAPLSENFVYAMLSSYADGTPAKRSKAPQKDILAIAKEFANDTNEQTKRRVELMVDALALARDVPTSSRMFAKMFDILKELEISEGAQTLVNSTLSCLLAMIQKSGAYKVQQLDVQADVVVDCLRRSQDQQTLRIALSFLDAAVKLTPEVVTTHVMSIFTFMGEGMLKKDNDLTLSVIAQTVEALFRAVMESEKKTDETATLQKLIATTKIFAASAPDISAHRRARIAAALGAAIGSNAAWTVVGVLLEAFCSRWQRTLPIDQSKKTFAESGQEAFDDIAHELIVSFSAVEQLGVILDLIQFVVRLGSDVDKPSTSGVDVAIFDKSKHSLPKLRHFRFLILGSVVKALNNKRIFEQLCALTDEQLYETVVPIGKRLMMASSELDQFAVAMSAVENSDPQTQRYWIALTTRADVIADKMRHLLPGAVAARLIADVLDDQSTSWKIREKALQLANMKLMHDGYFYADSGINQNQLGRLALVLNKWIGLENCRGEKAMLCQNAAFTLKLIAKRIPSKSNSPVLTDTLTKCMEMIENYKGLDNSLIGNMLLLSGELFRSHNSRSTMMAAVPLLRLCLEILADCITKQQHQQQQSASDDSLSKVNKRQRIRQQSLSGRYLGQETLLICALTCMQRILDQFAQFCVEHATDVLVRYCRLTARFRDADGVAGGMDMTATATGGVASKGTVPHRLAMIRESLLRMEFRVLYPHFIAAFDQLKTEEKSFCALLTLLNGFYTAKNRESIVSVRVNILKEIYLKTLEFRATSRSVEKFESVQQIESFVADSLLKMTEVLSEVQLRPVVATLTLWAEAALAPSADRNTKLRLWPLFAFANKFYQEFNTLALPYFGKIIEMCPKILRRCNVATATTDADLFFTSSKGSLEELELNALLTMALDLISSCARHKEFFTKDRALLVRDPLTDELMNTRLAGHESRCVPHLADALFRFADAHVEMFGELISAVLMKTRNNKPKIRYRTLLVLESIFDRVGDGLAPHLPIVMPFLSELIEDDNRKVEEQCEKVLRLLQKTFGENIVEGFA